MNIHEVTPHNQATGLADSPLASAELKIISKAKFARHNQSEPVETDHKPLLALLKTKMLDELTPRIQRFRMRLMQFSYIIYTAGTLTLCQGLLDLNQLNRKP